MNKIRMGLSRLFAILLSVCVIGMTGLMILPASAVEIQAIYVSTTGLDSNPGTLSSPTTLYSAVKMVTPGETIYLMAGTYDYLNTVVIDRGNDGTVNALKTIQPYRNGKVTLDFSSQPYGNPSSVSNPRGLQINGNYWHVMGLEVKGSADNGIYVAGNNITVELCETDYNRDTGLQIGRYMADAPNSTWPCNDLILDCTSHDNYDTDNGEDADGFACKLTTGTGNEFKGCLSYHNIDDGYDLYSKTDTGAIGPVTFENCVACYNGVLSDGVTTNNSDGNGFKLGGDKIAVAHVVKNCVAFNNNKHGFTYNSNPGSISLTNCTSYGNGIKSSGANFQFNDGTATFTNCLSLKGTASDKPNTSTDSSNVWGDKKGKSINSKGLSCSAADFVSITPPTTFVRNADGSINLGDFLKLKTGSSLIGAGTPAGTDIGANLSTSVPVPPPSTPTKPVASPVTANTMQATAVIGSLNASTSDGGTLTYSVSKQPAHGSITITSNNKFTYTPESSFFGTDTFEYTAANGSVLSDPATVTITVAKASSSTQVIWNDNFENYILGVFKATTPATKVSGDWTILDPSAPATPSDGGSCITSDSSGHGQYLELIDQGSANKIQFAALRKFAAQAADMTIQFDFRLHDLKIFQFSVADASGTQAVQLKTSNGALVYYLNDSTQTTIIPSLKANVWYTVKMTIHAGAATPTADVYGFNADGSEAGHVTAQALIAAVANIVQFEIDTPGTNKANVTADFDNLSLSVPKAAPVVIVKPSAKAAKFTTAQGTAISDKLSATVSDDSKLTYAAATQPAHGSLKLNADGSFTYTPNADFSGTDQFTFTATSNGSSSDPAQVTITVTPVTAAVPATPAQTQTGGNPKTGDSSNLQFIFIAMLASVGTLIPIGLRKKLLSHN